MSLEQWVRPRKIIQSADEWLSWDHPYPLLRLLHGKASDRKARLFESACLRRLSHWPPVAERRWAVEILERLAEGPVSRQEALAAAVALREVRDAATWVMGGMWNQAFADSEDQEPGAWPTAGRTTEAMSIAAGRLVRAAAGLEEDRPDDKQRLPEQRGQCDLLRCLVGNPFRPPPAVSPGWLAWNDGAVAKFAGVISAERNLPEGTLDRSRLTLLANALEDSGCTDAFILGHLRGPGPHVRGCHVIDMLLGKS